MSAPIITTIASSEYFTISTAGSAYFYPKILISNGAALSSESNADGNGSSFGHFYKSLISTCPCVFICNVSSFINTCNFAMDSTATISMWTSTGKYLQVPLVGPTFATVRKDMIAKEGIIINTVSTQNAYSTIVTYDPSFISSYIFKEGTYSTIITADNTGEYAYQLTFPDAVYLNLHKYGVNVFMSTTVENYNTTDTITTIGIDWYCNSSDHVVVTPLSATSPSALVNIWGDRFFIPTTDSNWSLYLTLTMSNLEPTTFYRLADSNEISAIAYPSYCNFTNVSICNFDAIQFPGGFSSYLSNNPGLKYYNSGSICLYSQINSNAYDQNHTVITFGYNLYYKIYPTCNYDSITFGSNVVDYILPTYPFDNWHLITITYSNYIKNRSNYYDLYTYYDSVLQYSNLSNTGHTSSFISNYMVVGCNYPANLMNLGIFDRCLCKREIELYMDIVYSGAGGGGGGGSGSGSGTGSGSGSGTGTDPPPS